MTDQKLVFDALRRNGVTFFTGVPDSYLNDFCAYALNVFPQKNLIAANEGNAVAIAAGYYFATKAIPLVYMQNSGMGNALNPLASLADARVYAVPMLLLIGWRGQPGAGDWPQHALQGEITPKLLDMMHIPYAVLSDDPAELEAAIRAAAEDCRANRRPYALIVPKGVMAGEKAACRDARYPMSREEAIETILDRLPGDTVYSATTGRATRELFFLRKRRGEGGEHDFLNVGSMGHASSVALGVAFARPGRKVVCLDGDAACIMHMGAMTMASKLRAPNFLHVVLNNGAHESVGGQPSAGHMIDLTKIAAACGYQTVGKAAESREELIGALDALNNPERAAFIDIRVHKGLNGKLPPLDFSHREAINSLIEALNRPEEKEEK